MRHVIIGNGPAGVVAAETLRRADPASEILLAGCENEPPYSRMAIPYLLEGNIDEAGTYLRKRPDHYSSQRISTHEGRVVSVDTEARTLLFKDGSSTTYDRLLVASGSHPVRPPIPGIDRPQTQTCWTLEDARAIAALTKPGSRVLQLGAGFIGCIIMEALAARGVELTVVEMGDRMVPRMMTPKAGNMIREWVESKGIRVRTSAGVERIDDGTGDAPLSVRLSTGECLPCDVVIVAAGVAPNIGFLEGSPVHVAKGVLVDDRMQTSVPGIYAAGDVAEAPDLFTGAHLVSAIQPNAVDQARVAAINMAGGDARMPGVLAINVLDTLGLISSSFGQWWGGEGTQGVERVDEAGFRYISLQFRDDVLVGATSIGLTDHVGALRGLIQGQLHLGVWRDRLLANPFAFFEAYVANTQPVALSRAA
ncbi:MAG: NAD(P)/FAD-dependent oxidoreductase [Rhodocyclaceae bacterium]|nr:NAD(P)/FAD-dependent oxidoreductase [Rhodocyclaceae bacterium]MCP5232873.1 NAD(P)/FAD-dependent oxidoreductase [Zoogloeaceae bacterium]MCB1912061.1 NAD(P)/FAD-dependent oxidoreductase [Rhodocyclaceae bacterium]MCP5238759.1 NAD(P)/FAD-dependent oxidoreductase [Zoogloeaceae bacterium]MCP5254354.1 NAD(P)/FAD-dependent oxidoreductase [Zoogloeaceae bacterium]